MTLDRAEVARTVTQSAARRGLSVAALAFEIGVDPRVLRRFLDGDTHVPFQDMKLVRAWLERGTAAAPRPAPVHAMDYLRPNRPKVGRKPKAPGTEPEAPKAQQGATSTGYEPERGAEPRPDRVVQATRSMMDRVLLTIGELTGRVAALEVTARDQAAELEELRARLEGGA